MAVPILSGQKTVAAAGTAERMPDQKGVRFIIRPLNGNTDAVFLGNDGTVNITPNGDVSSTTGYELVETDGPIEVCVYNLNALMIDAAVNGEGVSWLRIE